MNDADLIARLRSDHPDYLTSAAADRITALVAEREAHHANPADFRYWEGRYRDEKARAEAAEAQVARLREALADTTKALGDFVDTSAELRKPYEHPLSAYDRAMIILADTTPQSSAVDDKIGADAVAKAARVLLGAWEAHETEVSERYEKHLENGGQRIPFWRPDFNLAWVKGLAKHAIGEASRDR